MSKHKAKEKIKSLQIRVNKMKKFEQAMQEKVIEIEKITQLLKESSEKSSQVD